MFLAHCNMSQHIASSTMARLCARTLSAPELAIATEHLAVCASCHTQFRAMIDRRRGFQPISFNLAPEIWLRDEHLDYEQLAAYVDDNLDTEEREITDLHLGLCAHCREDVRSLRAFRQVIEPELQVAYAPAATLAPSQSKKAARRWLTWPKWPPAYALATVALLVLAASVAWLVARRDNSRIHAVQPVNTSHENQPGASLPAGKTPELAADTVPLLTEKKTAGVAPMTLTQEHQSLRSRSASQPSEGKPKPASRQKPEAAPALVIPPSTQPEHQAVVAQTSPFALKNLPPHIQAEIQQVWRREELEKPSVLNELAVAATAVRGSSDEPALVFHQLAPTGKVVLEAQPAFAWTALAHATSYRVYVLDTQGRAAITSTELPARQTRWRPAKPLPRGATYSWAVVALMEDGTEVVAPLASIPETRFHILATDIVYTLNSLQRQTKSPLVLGIFYAQAGLLNEAERELRRLVKLNPRVTVAQKLLQQVQEWQRAAPLNCCPPQ